MEMICNSVTCTLAANKLLLVRQTVVGFFKSIMVLNFTNAFQQNNVFFKQIFQQIVCQGNKEHTNQREQEA